MPSFAAFGNDLYTGRRSIDFIGRRRIWYTIAIVLMAVSFVALFTRGLNPGIEFRGGSEFRISKVAHQDQAIGQKAVTQLVPAAEVRVSAVGTDSVRIQTDTLQDSQVSTLRTALAGAYGVPVDNVSASFVGPTWGQDVSQKAYLGLGVFLVAVALFIALYFRTWKMAVAGIVALLHDLVLTIGIYAIVGFEVTPASVIGFLTILGYSLYDTVVVFDKVRENTDHIAGTTKRTFGEAANLAVNQTLVRSINTSVVALLPVGSILFIGAFLLGAGTLKDISLALFVGIAAGTYSSIFIATPLLVQLREREPELAAQAERVARRRSSGGVGSPLEVEPVPVPVAAGGGPIDLAGDAGRTPAAGQRPQPKRGSTGRNRPSGRKR